MANVRRVIWIVVLSLVSAACGPGTARPAAPWTASLEAREWTTIGDPDPLPLENDESGRLAFDFPVDTGWMKYIYHRRPPQRIGGSLVVSIHVITTGEVLFNHMPEPSNVCQTPATVRPFIWANANGLGESDRWWSNPIAYQLAEGSATLAIPLAPDQWSNVAGKLGTADPTTLSEFDAALGDVSSLGLTFGGGCFFGHGINAHGGTARFVISDYRTELAPR